MNGHTGADGRDPSKVTGVVLIVIGLLLLALQLATGITVTIMFLVVGAIFLARYFNRPAYGMLIPGCILVGMALGQLAEAYLTLFHNPNFVGLGVGFLAIFAVDKIYRGSSPWWPLVPGGVLLFMGLETGQLNMGTLISKGWPLALIVVGILYLTGKIGSSRDSSGGRDRPAGP